MAKGKVEIDVNLNGEKAQSGIKGIKSSLQSLGSSAEKAGSVFKNMLGANLVSSAIINSINNISSGVRSMVSELNSSAKAWKTFEGNMQMLGKSSEEITKAKLQMQDYASKTIYSASEMASTYSQLSAVGIKETDKLVTGFGGLAASAENPAQAMKTLSQQATQMAARPKVAWADFKLMLEQAPAGMAAIAKEMGMSTDQLVSKIQAGEVKTEDFFNAIKKVGNNESFSKMATQFKTVDQAIVGMKESLSIKLMPAFEKLNQFGIKAIESISNAIEKIDFNGVADSLGSFLESIDIESIISGIGKTITTVTGIVREFLSAFNSTGGISSTFQMLNNIREAVLNVINAMRETGVVTALGVAFGTLARVITEVVGAIAKFISKINPTVLAGITTSILGVVAVFKALNFLKSFNPFKIFKDKAKKSVEEVAASVGKNKSKIAQIFNGLSNVIRSIGTAIGTAAKGIGQGLAIAFRGLGSAIAIVPPPTWLALGAAILMVCAGLALLATQSSGISEILRTVGDVVTQVITTITTSLQTLIPLIVTGVTQIVTVVTQALATIIPLIVTGISQIVTSVTTGIATIINSISGVLQSIAEIIQSVGTAIKSVLEGLGAAFTGFGNGVRLALEGVGTVIQSVGTAIQTVLNGVATVVTSVGDAIKIVLEGLGSAFESLGKSIESVCNGISSVVESIGTAIKSVLEGIADVIRSIGDSAYDAGYGFKLFAEAMQTLSGIGLATLVSDITNMIKAVSKLANMSGDLSATINILIQIGQHLTTLSQSSTTLSNALSSILPNINNFKTTLDTIPTVLTSVVTAISNFGNQIMTSLSSLAQTNVHITTFNTQIQTITTTLATTISSLVNFTTQLQSMNSGLMMSSNSFNSFTYALFNITGTLSSVISVLTNFHNSLSITNNLLVQVGTIATNTANQMNMISMAANNVSNLVLTMATSVQNSVNGMASGIMNAMNSALSNINNATNQIVNAVRNMASQMQSEGQKAGADCSRSISQGLNSGQGAIRSSMTNIKSIIESVGHATVSSVTSIGAMISQGVANGMYSALWSVRAAANAIVMEVERAMRAKAQIHSPSRLMKNRVGKEIGRGVGEGILGQKRSISDKMGMIKDVIDGFKFQPENLLTFNGGLATTGAVNNSNSNINNTNNTYKSLLNIETFSNNNNDDVRTLFEKIKFLMREEGDRL